MIVGLQITRAGKSGLLKMGRMASKLLCICWHGKRLGGQETAVTEIKELETKRKEVRATGDGDKKQTGQTGPERQRRIKERSGTWTSCNQNGNCTVHYIAHPLKRDLYSVIILPSKMTLNPYENDNGKHV